MRGRQWRPSPEVAVTLAALPDAPRHFTEQARAQYLLLASALASRRAIEHADVAMIEMAASAYGEWFALDRRIADEDALLTESKKTGAQFLSGVAQARAAASNAYRRAIAQLGVGSPVARAAVFDTAQTDLFDVLDVPPPQGAPVDPYQPRTRH